ncbi:MalY/PatB family protein [Lachnospiraceae bacterium CLA-AA-H183]
MTTYNFDKITNRKGTNCLKYDFAVERGKPADVLPLWVADMDFPVSEEISKSLHAAVEHGIYGYTQPKDAYYNAVMNWMERKHNWKTKREWIVKTPGVVFALGAAVKAFTDPGDAILIQNPVYYPFTNIIRDNNRKVVDNTLVYHPVTERTVVPVTTDDVSEQQINNVGTVSPAYQIDFEDFERKIEQEHVKLFILCNPHNPVGRVWTVEELQKLGEICLRHHVIVVSDEIHNDFVYPGYEHTVFANVDPRFAEFTLTCTAPSKTFNLAGLQISNIFIPNENLRKAFKTEIDRTGYDEPNALGVVACEAAYRAGEDWLEQLRAYLLKNLNFLRDFLQEKIPQIHLVEPEGTYLVWLDCSELGITGKELDQFIVDKAGLWLDGGSMFGPSGAAFQRVNIACPQATLELALNKLKAAVEGHGTHL